jgi:spermidine/putrescine transport system permease protein
MSGRKSRALVGYALLYLAFLYAPILMIPLFSFNSSIYVAFPLKSFTWNWYAGLLADDRLHEAFFNSLKVGILASLAATGAGTLTAYALARRQSKQARWIATVALSPLVIPGIILGIALLIVVNLIGLGPSLTAVLLGHICLCLPLTILVMKGRFAAYSQSIEEAAMDLGATEWTTLLLVSLPIVMPGIMSCLMLSFTTSFDEFIVSFFLVGTEPTLPLFIWSQLRFPNQLPLMLALGTLILLVSCGLVLCAEGVRRRGLAAAERSPILVGV